MAKKDYYEVLGITKQASQEDIKKAYRNLAKVHHPDAGGNEDVFKEIAEAYEILSDPDKKVNYDTFGHSGPRNQPSDSFSSFMGDYFNEGPFGAPPKRVGDDLFLIVKLTLEEVFTGTNKKFKYKRNTTCNTCSGNGGTGSKTCTTCGGSGQVLQTMRTPFGDLLMKNGCHVCHGNGVTLDSICEDCGGEGVVQTEEIVEINIPHGVADGFKGTLKGKGNFIKNGIAGDLIVTVQELPHNIFIRHVHDLKFVVSLTYPQLILGDKIELTTIDGGKIRATIPELSKVGDMLRVQGKGLKVMNRDDRGDMLLTIELKIPKSISEEERDIIKKLKKLNEKVAS